jgi:hypothetical protein
MSRKDYVVIAEAIRRTREATDNVVAQATLSTLSITIAADLQADNARFDLDRFLRACGTTK